MEVKKVLIDDILIPPVRATSKLDESQKAILKGTVEKFGVLNEPIVRPLASGGYELIAGKSRIDELRRQGAKEVDVKIIDANDKDAMMMHLAENMARGKTDPISEAEVLDRYIKTGATIEDAAKIVGHPKEWVRFRLSLNLLPDKYKKALREGTLKLGHIEAASLLPTPEEVDYALGLALTTKWTVSVLENYVKRRLADLEAARMKEEMGPPPELPSIEKAQEIVRYFTCAGCNRNVDKSLARTPPLCEECLALIRYSTTQLGAPKEAMEYIYKAVSHYQRYLEYQKQKAIFEEMEKPSSPPTSPPAGGPLPPREEEVKHEEKRKPEEEPRSYGSQGSV